MRQLDAGALPLIEEHQGDPLVLRFIELYDRTARAEMISDPCTWSEDARAAYLAGDWRSFSHLRGYAATEIADYLHAAGEVDATHGPDTAASLAFLVRQHTEAA